MSTAGNEVRTKLTLDDAASAAVARIRSGFERLNQTVAGAAGGVLRFGKDVAAVALGVNLGNILGSIQSIGTAAFRAAGEGQLQMRELGKAMAGLASKKGGGMEDFVRAAESVHSRLSAVAREAMVARGELVAAFAETAKSTTLTHEKLTKLIGDVARAGRALPAPISEVVKGFEQFRKNVISADNPLVTMIKQANLMRGHTEQITLRLQAMGRQRALALAQRALTVMQERAKALPPTLSDMVGQFNALREDVMRVMGAPMLAALTPAFGKLQRWIASHRIEIERYARMMGQQVGEWILAAARKIQEGFLYVRTHSVEIKQAITSAFSYAKTVWEFIVRNKELIAGGLVASQLAPTAMSAAGAVAGFSKGLVELARTGIPAMGIAASGFATGLKGAAGTLGLFVAAVGSVMVAFDQYQRLLKETGGAGLIDALTGRHEDVATAKARKSAIERYATEYAPADEAAKAQFEKWAQSVRAHAEDLGMTADQVELMVTQARRSREELAAATEGMRVAADIAQRLPSAFDAPAADMRAAHSEQLRAAQSFAMSYQAASRSGNAAAVQAAVQILAGSKGLQVALLKAGTEAGLSLDELADVVGSKLGDFADKLRQQAGLEAEKRATGEKGAVPTNVFNGGQTFNIKQDFRDQDPDRIAVIFERDLARAAQQRLQARTSLPFGG